MSEYSVLMTVYEKDDPLAVRQSIDSMFNQSKKTNDFVLICDGELTPELYAIVDEYSRKENVFSVYRLEKNIGLGAALKYGVPMCSNEYIARMDDDDIAESDRCAKEVEFLDNHPSVAIVGSYVSEFENTPDNVLRLKVVPTDSNSILCYSKRRNPFNHSTVMFRKSAIIAVGNYSEMRTNQDVELWVRLLNNGYVGNNIPEPLVRFRFNKETYRRRKEKKNLSLMISIWREFYKKDYCSLIDYICVVCMQLVIFVMPSRFMELAYNHFRG